MQDRHAVVILLVDALLVLGDQSLKTLVEFILGCKHHWRQTLTVLDSHLLLVIDEIKHCLNHVFVLVPDRKEYGRPVSLINIIIVEWLSMVIKQQFTAVFLLVEDGEVKRAQQMLVQYIYVSVVFD